MEAKELRIGNYLKKESFPTVWKLEMFLGSEVCSVINIAGYDYHEPNLKDLEPIELTEEWLTKFGFVLDLEMDTYYIECEEFTFHIEGYSQNPMIEDQYGVKLNHVHQLQNLYFALTGKELKIKS